MATNTNVTTEEHVNICALTPERVELKIITTTTVGDKVYQDGIEMFNRRNSESDRLSVKEKLESGYPAHYAAIMAMWGDSPTVSEEIPEVTAESF